MIAAIDLGSNAVRMVISKLRGDHSVETFMSTREAVRLGQEVFTKGSIGENTIKVLVQVFTKFSSAMQEQKVSQYRAVATSAIREARNRKQILEQVRKSSGIDLEVISGKEEAELVFRAVSHKVKLDSKLALLIDIGGGSVEITIVKDSKILDAESFRMGAVRLLSEMQETKIDEKNINLLIRDGIENIEKKIRKFVGKRKIDVTLCTGGNVEALGDLRKKIYSRSSDELKISELEELIEKLQSLSIQDRVRELDLKPDRADVILPAALVLQKIMKVADVNTVVIPRVGVKDGVLLQLVDKMNDKVEKDQQEQVFQSALNLGQKFDFDELHARIVARHAKSIFEQIVKLHQLDSRFGLLLETAALLHDVGYHIAETAHHKHSYYLINNSSILGLTEREMHLVALVARYHRKSLPSNKHEPYSSLSLKEQSVVRKLAALLRIADAMDRSHCGVVESFQIQLQPSKITLKLSGTPPFLLEKWAIMKKADLFENEYGVNLLIENAK